ITHDMAVVAENSDRVLILQHGSLREKNVIYRIFNEPQHPYTQQLISAVPKIEQQEDAPISISPESDSTLLSTRDLTVRFDLKGGFLKRIRQQVHAVESVSFDIGVNETFALVGESGCGKST